MVPLKVRRRVFTAKESLADIKPELEEALSLFTSPDRINEDRIKWALAKIGDTERLLNSIK